MDAWTDDQLKKMQLGGNKRLNDFLGEYGVEKHTSIPEKYHTKAAEALREMIKAEAKGETYNLPPRDQLIGSLSHSGSAASLNKTGQGMQGIPEAYQSSAANKGAFFDRKMAENANRAEGVHPSQGGKYVGFGSTPSPSQGGGGNMGGAGVNEITSMLSTGWNRFATVTTAAAAQAGATVSQAARTIDEQARTGQLGNNVQTGATQALSKAQELGTTGWGMLSTLATGVVANVRKIAGDEGAPGGSGAAGMGGGGGTSDDWGGHGAGFAGFGGFDGDEGARMVAGNAAQRQEEEAAWSRGRSGAGGAGDNAGVGSWDSDHGAAIGSSTQSAGAARRAAAPNKDDDDEWGEW